MSSTDQGGAKRWIARLGQRHLFTHLNQWTGGGFGYASPGVVASERQRGGHCQGKRADQQDNSRHRLPPTQRLVLRIANHRHGVTVVTISRKLLGSSNPREKSVLFVASWQRSLGILKLASVSGSFSLIC
jgi:hypothetical protein